MCADTLRSPTAKAGTASVREPHESPHKPDLPTIRDTAATPRPAPVPGPPKPSDKARAASRPPPESTESPDSPPTTPATSPAPSNAAVHAPQIVKYQESFLWPLTIKLCHSGYWLLATGYWLLATSS